MYRIFVIIIVTFLSIHTMYSQPKREVRAVWLTTAYGLDWPSARATTYQSMRRQHAELCRMLDKLKEANFNTILFQVRVRGDVVYPSNIEPYHAVFAGKSGKSPGYDPLAFAIKECHKRGMELHAWMVAIPLGTVKHVRSLGAASIVKKKTSLCKQYKGEWFLDPGNPGTKEYLNRLVEEIVSHYDVDGIHLDYIRYPDHPAAFPDKDTYRKYGQGKLLADWRRDNITAIVRSIYQTVKSLKAWVKVSSSPIGKFRDTSRYSSRGWNGYYAVYQNAQGWLREGIQDMLFPMMYFKEDQFYPFALDWQEQSCGRAVVPGLGVYFLHPSEKDWELGDIERQINFLRKEGLAGQAYYRAKFVTDNTKGLLDELESKYYPYPALTTALIGNGNVEQLSPGNLRIEETVGETNLSWSAAVGNEQSIPYYIIYASDDYPVDITLAENIVAANIRGNSYTYSYIYPEMRKRYFAVTAIDRFGHESKATQSYSRNDGNFLHSNGEVLYLPPIPEACFVTITDITGRCVLHLPYMQDIILKGLLEQGSYKVLIMDSNGRIKDYTLLVQRIDAQ